MVVSSIGGNELSLGSLNKLFKTYSNKVERNMKIVEAVENGYSQHAIAKVLGVTQGTVSHVVKKYRDNN